MQYYAAPACDELLPEMHREDWSSSTVTRWDSPNPAPRGFNQWFFFTDIAPVVAFIRAGQMSKDTAASLGVYHATHELVFYFRHRADELLLLIRPISSGGHIDLEETTSCNSN